MPQINENMENFFEMYGIEGCRMALRRSGHGEPAIVFLPGAGMVGLDFLNIHEEVSQFTASVIYDRAGTGWSDEIALPRSAAEVTNDLHSLLQAASVPTPYILVGHSLGGGYARRYAQRFPDEVAGLLLLEPYHEDFMAHMPKQTFFDQLQGTVATLGILLKYKQFYRDMFSKMFASWPGEVREPLVDWHLKHLTKTFQEFPASQRTDSGPLATELRSGGNLPDVPMIVLCALGIDPSMDATMSASFLRKMNDGKRAAYTALASSYSHGEYRELEDAGHSAMHIDRPDAIVKAIRDLIDRSQH